MNSHRFCSGVAQLLTDHVLVQNRRPVPEPRGSQAADCFERFHSVTLLSVSLWVSQLRFITNLTIHN